MATSMWGCKTESALLGQRRPVRVITMLRKMHHSQSRGSQTAKKNGNRRKFIYFADIGKACFSIQ